MQPKNIPAVTQPMDSAWLRPLRTVPSPLVSVFLLPYAGGDASSIYREWAQHFTLPLDIFAVQLPGRGIRMRDVPYTDCTSLVTALLPVLYKFIERPIAIFGHSMGAIIAYEAGRLLLAKDPYLQVRLFLSGRQPPHLPSKMDKPAYDCPDAEFLQELALLNGTPKQVLENADLMEALLPVLRADFQLCQTYRHTEKGRFAGPMTVLSGLEDRMSAWQMGTWQDLATGPFALHMCEDGHFFLHEHGPWVVQVMQRELEPICTASVNSHIRNTYTE